MMKKLLSIITILTLLMPHASYAKVDKDVNVAKVQAMLAELCYEPGIVDGAWGKKTETAVKAFFAKHYRKYDGNFDVNDANFILSAGASAKAFGSASVKKCLVVYSDRIGDSLKNAKIKQITQKVANKKKKSEIIHYFEINGRYRITLIGNPMTRHYHFITNRPQALFIKEKGGEISLIKFMQVQTFQIY